MRYGTSYDKSHPKKKVTEFAIGRDAITDRATNWKLG